MTLDITGRHRVHVACSIPYKFSTSPGIIFKDGRVHAVAYSSMTSK